MTDLSPLNGAEQPGTTYIAVGAAPLIRVAASEQQDPGAIERCPVCGMLYTLAGQPAESSPVDSERAETTLPTGVPAARVVMRCSDCGTYSVGAQPTG
jgi:hypothetical protein